MSIPAEALRLQLITQITNLPPDLLPAAHELLAHLECGDLSPLSVLECGDLSPLSFSLPSPVAPVSTPTSASLPRPGPQRPSPPPLPSEGSESPHSKDWPHAPIHRLSKIGTYIVTAGTLHKRHIFREPEQLDLLEEELLSLATEYRWHIEAWAVFSNSKQTESTSTTTSPRSCRENRQPGAAGRKRKKVTVHGSTENKTANER
jgi:hypothetical protein